MRGYTRIVFGLNALYQGAAGCIFLFAPAMAIGLYGFPEGTEEDHSPLAWIVNSAYEIVDRGTHYALRQG